MRIEVKLGGSKHMGRFLPYGKAPVGNTIGENAVNYVADPRHADFYAFSATIKGMGGRAAGKGGKVLVVVYSREQVLDAIRRFNEGGSAPALTVHNGGVALGKVLYNIIRQTFGIPVQEVVVEGLTRMDDIPADPGCPNAPYARAWEKICARALDGKWTGALRNVQIDIVVNEGDD